MRGVALVLAGAVVAAAVAYPDRAPHAQAQPNPDLARAKDLYKSAETAVAEGRFDEAARDYGAAYEISKDPVLFFKIASANEKAKRCEVAVVYYRRYLREARPGDDFVKLTNQRITACGGEPGPGSGEPVGSGSAPVGSGSAPVGSGSAPGRGSGLTGMGSAPDPGPGSQAGSGSAVGSAAPVKPLVAKNRTAWLLIGGSLTFITVGAILAYSADAAEADIDDLYVGFNGQPPVFDAKTQQRYNDLLGEGRRYEKLSWISFGLAGAFAAGAAVMFALDGKGKPTEKSVRITPVVTPGGAGAAATIRW